MALDELATNLDRVMGADIVVDYIWGAPAAELMAGFARARHDSAQPLAWIQIGSVPVADILAELPELAVAISNGTLRTQARAVPLAEVEQVWQQPENGQRVVFTT